VLRLEAAAPEPEAEDRRLGLIRAALAKAQAEDAAGSRTARPTESTAIGAVVCRVRSTGSLLESLRVLMNIRWVHEDHIETLGKRCLMWVLDCDRCPW
jgi:hypothetical protein